MKSIAIGLIIIYQKIIAQFLKNLFGITASCRFYPTCSNYAKDSIKEYGIIRGFSMAFSRILRCQPFYKSSVYDRSF